MIILILGYEKEKKNVKHEDWLKFDGFRNWKNLLRSLYMGRSQI